MQYHISMKVLTLNAHSLSEENQAVKTEQTARFITEHSIDVILLQEVCQTIHEEPIPSDAFYTGIENLRTDNYALSLSRCLQDLHTPYYWTWLPIKLGFGRFEEGVAIFSKKPILAEESWTITREQDFMNWRKRAVLAVQNSDGWFCSTHMGWWRDQSEPFMEQLEHLNAPLFAKEGRIFLGGDFNAPDFIEDESYAAVTQSGWLDTYELAESRSGRYTAEGNIVGWQNSTLQKMRIDYIFVNESIPVTTSSVVFNNQTGPQVSDHYGVLIEADC